MIDPKTYLVELHTLPFIVSLHEFLVHNLWKSQLWLVFSFNSQNDDVNSRQSAKISTLVTLHNWSETSGTDQLVFGMQESKKTTWHPRCLPPGRVHYRYVLHALEGLQSLQWEIDMSTFKVVCTVSGWRPTHQVWFTYWDSGHRIRRYQICWDLLSMRGMRAQKDWSRSKAIWVNRVESLECQRKLRLYLIRRFCW